MPCIYLGRRVERFFGSLRFVGSIFDRGYRRQSFSFVFTEAPSLGSSTAIFGLLGAEGIFIYQHRKLFGEQFKVALRQIIQVAVGNLVIGFMIPGIDNYGAYRWFDWGANLYLVWGTQFFNCKARRLICTSKINARKRKIALFIVLICCSLLILIICLVD